MQAIHSRNEWVAVNHDMVKAVDVLVELAKGVGEKVDILLGRAI